MQYETSDITWFGLEAKFWPQFPKIGFGLGLVVHFLAPAAASRPKYWPQHHSIGSGLVTLTSSYPSTFWPWFRGQNFWPHLVLMTDFSPWLASRPIFWQRPDYWGQVQTRDDVDAIFCLIRESQARPPNGHSQESTVPEIPGANEIPGILKIFQNCHFFCILIVPYYVKPVFQITFRWRALNSEQLCHILNSWN